MAYTRTEYSRERDIDRDDHKQGGWRSWFGLDDKKDHDDGYNYASTTTYRNPQSGYSGYSGEARTGGYSGEMRTGGYSGAVSGGYSGPRGGYGYTTSDECNRGPYSQDREYSYGNTRPSYGFSGDRTGDRDVYSKTETRTYGGDNWTGRNTGTPSRSYTYERDHPSNTRDYSYTSRNMNTTSDYPTSRNFTSTSDYHPSMTSGRSYGFSGENTRYGRDNNNESSYTTSRTYPMTGDSSSRYETSRYETSRPEWNSSTRMTTSGDRDSYGTRGGNTGYGYERDYTTTRSSRY